MAGMHIIGFKMAGDTDIAESSAKTFKCHSNILVPKIVICIICESVFHTNDFNRCNKGGSGKFISDMLVICAKHNVDITSKNKFDNIELCENARTIIAHTKMFEKDKVREDIRHNISLNKTRESMLMDDTIIEDELAMLKVENDLLKELNTELKEKNELLREIVKDKSNNNNSNAASYADITKSDVTDTRKIIPNIVVKAKDKNDRDTVNQVKNQLLGDITVPIKKLLTNKTGDVTIKCKNKEDVGRTMAILSNKLKNKYQVEVQTLKAPRMKILNVQNDMNLDDLTEDIKNRNPAMLNGNFTLVNEFKNASKQRTVILEAAPEIYSAIVKNEYKLYTGYQCCKVVDDINLNLCFKCGRSNHSGKNCKNETKCLKCSGDHETTNCKADTIKCVNCAFYNGKYNQDKCTNHHPNDTSKCEYIKFKLQKLLNTTDYPTMPKIPKFLGRIPGQGKETTLLTNN